MKIQELRDKASMLKREKQSFLNDTFFWVKLAREAVEQLPDTKFEFEVPKAGMAGKMRTVARNNGQKIKNRIVNRDIYNSAFVSLVAAVEDYLSKIMIWILLCDNKRIKCTIAGVNFSKEISIVDLIDKDKDALIKSIIDQRVEGLFYASPRKQIEYFDKALGIKIDNDIWGKWVEIKARRDLWVHNAGIVNQLYIDKVKEFKLCDLGDEAVIDEQYFSDCVVILKILIGRIDREIKNVYKV
ncbi:MAG: hypothetical protein HFE34_06230 [Clostridia bacterium]|nr:hypothetical protein [Clostridia bacterium]